MPAYPGPPEPDGQKWCNGCKRLKPYTEFRKETRGRHGLSHRCAECLRPTEREKMRRYRAADPEHASTLQRRSHARTRYGVEWSWVEEQIEVSGGACPTCLRQYNRNVRGLQPCVEHDHITGAIRGVLCRMCNIALGSVRDDPDTLERLIKWLRRSTA